jgi:hypothetical protein
VPLGVYRYQDFQKHRAAADTQFLRVIDDVTPPADGVPNRPGRNHQGGHKPQDADKLDILSWRLPEETKTANQDEAYQDGD